MRAISKWFPAIFLLAAVQAGADARILKNLNQTLAQTPVYLKNLSEWSSAGATHVAYGCDDFGYFIADFPLPKLEAAPPPSFRCALKIKVRVGGKWRTIKTERPSNPLGPFNLEVSGAFPASLFWANLTLAHEGDSLTFPALVNSRGEILYAASFAALGVGAHAGRLFAYSGEAYWKLLPGTAPERVRWPDAVRDQKGKPERLKRARFGSRIATVHRGCSPVLKPYPKKVFDYAEPWRWLTLFLKPLTYSYDNLLIDGASAVEGRRSFPLSFPTSAVLHAQETEYREVPALEAARELSRKKAFEGCNVAWNDSTDLIVSDESAYLLYRDARALIRHAPSSNRWINLAKAALPPPNKLGHLSLAFSDGFVYLLSSLEDGRSGREYLVRRGRVDRDAWTPDPRFRVVLPAGVYPEAHVAVVGKRLLAFTGADLKDRFAIHAIDTAAGSSAATLIVHNADARVRLYDTEVFPLNKLSNYTFRDGPL